MKTFILFFCLTASAQTNYVSVPGGAPVEATSDAGYYWAGFAVGFGFYVVGMVIKMGKRVGACGSYD